MLNSKSIGNKIAGARKKINLSQADLAQQVSISPQAVGKWERGESMPDITTLNRLAEIMGVDLNYFSENYQSIDAEGTTNEDSKKKAIEIPNSRSKEKLSWDMSKGNWVDADFSGLKNLKDKFSFSNMKNCKFVGSELSGLLLKGNNIEGCDFSNSDISGCQIQRSNLGNNSFRDCNLREAEFLENNIRGCDFSSCDFTKTKFKSGTFLNNTLTSAVWKHTSFKEMHLDDLVFEGVLEDCYFENCSFYKVKFQNSTLLNPFFKNNKNLKRIKFIDCKADRLTYEFLKSGKADLTGLTAII